MGKRQGLAGIMVIGLGMIALLRILSAQAAPTTQSDCTLLIPDLEDALAVCDTLNDNEICYGSDIVFARPDDLFFFRQGDRVDLRALEEISAVDEDGLSVFNLLASGEIDPIFGVVIGPLSLETDRGAILSMRSTGGTLTCETTPPGLLVRTEDGRRGRFRIGQTEIELGSTAYIIADAEGNLRVVNLDGRVAVSAGGIRAVVPEGRQIEVKDGELAGVDDLDAQAETPATVEPTRPAGVTPTPTAYAVGDFDFTIPMRPTATPGVNCNRDIGIGETIIESNYRPGQVCLIEFCAQAGESISIEMRSLDGDMDPWIELRGPDYLPINYNDDIEPGDDLNSRLCNQVLPEDGCYTVAAHTYRYRTAGRFSLAVVPGDPSCVPPVYMCTVVTYQGLHLRSEPRIDADSIAVLPRNSTVESIEWNREAGWRKVRDKEGREGWMKDDPDLLHCPKPPTPPPIVSPDPPPTATPDTSTPVSPTQEPRKQGVFTGP